MIEIDRRQEVNSGRGYDLISARTSFSTKKNTDYLIGNARNAGHMFTFDPDLKIACVRRPIVIAVHFVLSSKNYEKCSLRGFQLYGNRPVDRPYVLNLIERIKSSSCTSLVSTVFQIRKPYFPSNVASIVIYNIYIV